MANRLSSLARTPSNDAEMLRYLQEQNQPPSRMITNDSIRNQQPMNTIRVDQTGEYLTPQGNRQEAPAQFQSAKKIYLDGKPALLDEQGNIEVDTDAGKMYTTMAQVERNAAEQRYRQQIADMPRQKQMADIEKTQAEAMKLRGEAAGGVKPQFSAEMGGYVYPPSQEYPQGRVIPLSGSKPTAKIQDANEALSIIKQAKDIFDTGDATESYLGKAVDIGGSIFGVGTTGAQSAAKLKALGGALVAKMPKMSGPQSDKDVQLYREMAGQIADDTVPISTRRAALQTVEELQKKYAGITEMQQPALGGQNRDQEALAWANANPNDPRAAAILRANAR